LKCGGRKEAFLSRGTEDLLVWERKVPRREGVGEMQVGGVLAGSPVEGRAYYHKLS